MVKQSHRGVAHRADQRDLVEDLRELGHQLGHLDAGKLGIDRLEDTADLVGNVILGVPKVEVTGAALKIEKDDALGLLKPGPAADPLVGRRLLQTKDVSQAKAERRRTAHAQHIAAGYSITGILPRTSWNHEHGQHLKNGQT